MNDVLLTYFGLDSPSHIHSPKHRILYNINAGYKYTSYRFVGQLYVISLKSLTSGSVKFLVVQPALQGEA